MKGTKFALVLCCIAALTGCAAMFGRSTSDPAVKLQWASELFSSKDEPVEAEKLIRDAIDMYELKRDHLGLAEAYRQYGLFFRSNAVSKFEDYYNTNGFLDEKVKFKDRYVKAIEYFNKSKELYADFGHYDVLSNLYISLAKTYVLTNRQDEACSAFTKSVESFTRFKKENQDVQEQRSLEITNYMEYVDLMKKQAGCPEEPPPPPAKPAPRPAPTSPYAPSEQPTRPEQPAPMTQPAQQQQTAPQSP